LRPVVKADVSHGAAMGNRVGREEEGAVQLQWIEEERPDGPLKSQAGDDLDRAPSKAEGNVVIGPNLTERGELGQVDELIHHPGDRVVAGAAVREEVAGPAANVGQRVTQGHACRDILLRQPQLRQVGPDRSVEVERALVDQAHDRGRGEGLRDRANLEQSRGVDGQRILDARYAKALGNLFPPL
jgi:hypothetical protein